MRAFSGIDTGRGATGGSKDLTTRFPARVAVVALLSVLAGCSTTSDEAAAGGSAAAPAAGGSAVAATPDSGGGMAGMDHSTMGGMTPMGGATGDPDRDFLRMMSEHHKGMIAMAHLTIEEKKGSAATQADAEKLDIAQDAELDSMVTKLEQQFKDAYDPKIMPDNQKMVDELKTQSGAAYDRMFYQHVVHHHQQATQMIDQHLPMLKDPKIKAMAERMKRDQTREIAEFQRKASGQ
jgi:uncharacterized protein (DUF305 family)